MGKQLNTGRKRQLNKGRDAPPYTNERNPQENTKAHNRKLNPRSRNPAFVTCNRVAWFSGVCWALIRATFVVQALNSHGNWSSYLVNGHVKQQLCRKKVSGKSAESSAKNKDSREIAFFQRLLKALSKTLFPSDSICNIIVLQPTWA